MHTTLDIRRYTAQQRAEWDEMVNRSVNGTFLFLRNYMEYHADRFEDHSLMVYNDTRLLAVLPATRHNDTIISHGGLTYGGIVTRAATTSQQLINIFNSLSQHLRNEGFKTWIYKPVPHIYHSYPYEGEQYALFKARASHTACNLSSAIELSCRMRYADLRRRGVKRALLNGVDLIESNDYAPFWQVLENCLQERHGVKPVHSLEEITLLHNRFPQNIRLHTACKEGVVIAGCVVYNTGTVAHAQYISASQQGKDCGALDLLFAHLIEQEYSTCRYFDFGISTEEGGNILNSGLLSQKEGFGARGITYDTYRITL